MTSGIGLSIACSRLITHVVRSKLTKHNQPRVIYTVSAGNAPDVVGRQIGWAHNLPLRSEEKEQR